MPDDFVSPRDEHRGGDAWTVRCLLREATFATLATLDRKTGHPFASLVSIATLPGSEPVFLISALAQHTRNLMADHRASLLVDRRAEAGADLTAARATIVGTARRLGESIEAVAQRRLLARHPSADRYAGFGDFGTWSVEIERAHLVAGFGRIREVAGRDIVFKDGVEALSIVEPALLLRLNHELHLEEKGVRLIGLDIEGLDLSGPNGHARLLFDQLCCDAQITEKCARTAISLYLAKA